MSIFLWFTGSVTGLGLLAIISIWLYLMFADTGPEGLAWAMLGFYTMIGTGLFGLIHAIGWLGKWFVQMKQYATRYNEELGWTILNPNTIEVINSDNRNEDFDIKLVTPEGLPIYRVKTFTGFNLNKSK